MRDGYILASALDPSDRSNGRRQLLLIRGSLLTRAIRRFARSIVDGGVFAFRRHSLLLRPALMAPRCGAPCWFVLSEKLLVLRQGKVRAGAVATPVSVSEANPRRSRESAILQGQRGSHPFGIVDENRNPQTRLTLYAELALY